MTPFRAGHESLEAVLALADGTCFKGIGFGAPTSRAGEVVFNTSMVGYEEAITDPSYKGQILTFTYPLIGNYGVRKDRFESDGPQVEGLVVRQLSDFYKHPLAVQGVSEWLAREKIPGIAGIDTRMLTKKIRETGVMNGALVVGESVDEDDALKSAERQKSISDVDVLSKVGVKEPKEIRPDKEAAERLKRKKGKEKTVLLVDCGVKLSIIRCLTERGVNVVLVPSDFSEKQAARLDFDAAFVSNGPGDPKRAGTTVALVKALAENNVLFGICFGNQLLAHALGGTTYKLKYGHRGGNQPVKDFHNGRVYVTSQNHGFAVDEKSLEGTGLKATVFNLNDGSVEGTRHRKKPLWSVQYHPEANPGPLDCLEYFDEFVDKI